MLRNHRQPIYFKHHWQLQRRVKEQQQVPRPAFVQLARSSRAGGLASVLAQHPAPQAGGRACAGGMQQQRLSQQLDFKINRQEAK